MPEYGYPYLVFRMLLLDPVSVILSSFARCRAFGDEDDGAVLALSDSPAYEIFELVDVGLILGDDGGFRAAGYGAVLRKETRIAAHYLDKEDAVVARSGVAYLVNTLNDGVESGVVANGIIRTVEVVVNGARQANAGDVILLCKCQGAGK